MGSQQLLMIVLGVIVMAIAIVVGITLFRSNASSSNRDEVINRLMTLSAQAQTFYRTPAEFAGGGYSFQDYVLSNQDTGDASGSYSIRHTLPSSKHWRRGGMSPTHTATGTIYIIGCGKELGKDGVDPVKAYASVSQDSVSVVIMN